MELRLSDEQGQLVASFRDLFARHAPTTRVRECEDTGHDADLWAALGQVGVVQMGLPAAVGGWDASLLDLALVAEQAGRALAPAPIIECQVVARLLAECDHQAAADTLAACLEGSIATLALHPATGHRARLVPAGAVAHQALVLAGDRLLLLHTAAAEIAPVSNLGAQPLADLSLTGSEVELASGPAAVELHRSAVEEWLVLTAAAVTGIAAEAHAFAVAYACERKAFGSPIGSFQAISHPLADDATALDGALLLARKAAWAKAAEPARFPELAAMAFAFASEAARDATYHALHTHGGYGFMLEQDVQLHYRRARGWARVFGGPDSAFERVADARYGSAA